MRSALNVTGIRLPRPFQALGSFGSRVDFAICDFGVGVAMQLFSEQMSKRATSVAAKCHGAQRAYATVHTRLIAVATGAHEQVCHSGNPPRVPQRHLSADE